MLKRLIFTALSIAALTYSASAANALPATSGGQTFYVSTSLSDAVGKPADPTIYNIGGNTYFKLRDLGRLLDFGVTYDKATNAVHIDPDAAYVPVSGESSTIQNTATAPASAVVTRQTLYLNGSLISPTVYNIKGNNYIALRALGQLVDFGVSYNYDNRRITAYAAYPYAEETTWSAAMNDLANNLRVLPASSFSDTANRYAPIITDEANADWRDLISQLRAVKGAPLYASSNNTLYRSNLYWADRLTAALTNTTPAATPQYSGSLTALADSDLFDNPDKNMLQADFQAMSTAYLGAKPASLSDVTVSNGYSRDARSRPSLTDTYTLTGGATASDYTAAKRYFSSDMAKLSSLHSDEERVAYIYELLQREFRTGGNASWVKSYNKNGSVSTRSLAAAADWMFSEAGIPSFLVRSWSTAWNVVYVNGQWAVFDFTKGSTLRSLDEYHLIDLNPGSTLLLTQVMRPGASYYNLRTATVDKYFTYTSIAGTAQATAKQMQTYIKKVNPNVPQSVIDMIPYYLSEGQAEGIRGDIAFAQSCLETGNFTFKDSAVKLEQNNFCGLGVLDNGMLGASFDTPQLGIRAQIQHLKAYANKSPLNNPVIDPRFSLVTRGAAPTVQYLGIQENPHGYGWAAGADYGVKILNILENILAC
ncbi:glucosaminidase domain-containing protein [uncultured Agathobaculum sp.]|uniref:glucosaminidase domain-containing protein n=1 Tax=uncultured Agathobaculum sp. TaxID=2048140 RepID=UPI00320B161B